MSNNFRNHEFYPDPTAFAALRNIEREPKQKINRPKPRHRGGRRHKKRRPTR